MKQKTGFVALLMALVYVLTACSIPFTYPDSGQFYCDELQMTLDFSSQKAVFTVEGKDVTGYFLIGFDAQIYVEYADYTPEEPIYHNVLTGEFKYKSGKVIVKADDGQEYIFIPKTGGQFFSLVLQKNLDLIREKGLK